MTTFGLVTLEHEDPDATVLVVTSGWPYPDDPTYCIFVKRQVDSLRAAGIRCDVVFIRGFRTSAAYLIAALQLFLWSFGRRYSLIHAHGGEAAIVARCYLRAPLLISFLGTDLLGRPNRRGHTPMISRLKRTLIRQHARSAKATITKTREMERALPRRIRSRNMVVPNGVDSHRFHPQDRLAAREALGWRPDAHVALSVANLSTAAQADRKRLWLAEEAIDLVRRSIPDAELVIANGVDPDLIPAYMNAADCLVITSSVEGSPNVVKEALMCNLPVVATASGDIRELLAEVEPSYLVDSTPKSIAAAIGECFRGRVRSNGRSKISHRLSAESVAQRLVDVYAALGLRSGQRDVAPEPNEAVV